MSGFFHGVEAAVSCFHELFAFLVGLNGFRVGAGEGLCAVADGVDVHVGEAGGFERLQVVLLGSAIIVDLYVLVAMLTRIGAFGFSPNKVASLGLNMLLLVNLVGSVVMLVGFLRGRRPYAHLERWQTGYLPAYLAWAVIVGVAFGPVFGWV